MKVLTATASLPPPGRE